jgi:hypothetical protein
MDPFFLKNTKLVLFLTCQFLFPNSKLHLKNLSIPLSQLKVAPQKYRKPSFFISPNHFCQSKSPAIAVALSRYNYLLICTIYPIYLDLTRYLELCSQLRLAHTSRRRLRLLGSICLSYLAKSSIIQQCFSLTINQQTVLSATVNQRNEQATSRRRTLRHGTLGHV